MTIKIGITERGDAGLDFSWVDKLMPANIIISKSLNEQLIRQLIINKDKVIIHITCTGFGGSILEPNVPNKFWTRKQVSTLITSGFPVEQTVLRVDPIIPTELGLRTAECVLDLFRHTGIKRLRYSFMDMYGHVKSRFEAAKLPLPYTTFTAPPEMVNNALKLFKKYESCYEFEACAEDTPHKLGCISQKDFDVLKITERAVPDSIQRRSCSCASGKTELLVERKRCWHGCIYCYWKA